jgi:hypothetical protein
MELIKVEMDDCRRATRPQSDTPVFDYCRKLVSDGVDSSTKLEVYRGTVLALTIRTIGEGAKLTVKENGCGTSVFAEYRPFNKEWLK